MASYLSYFSSNSSSAPSQQQYNQAQPATSTWANTFSSRIATLRKALTKDSEDDDPDNEDCSHVSNVLRAYYTQKGRQFPEWLPPDPKKPQAPPPQQTYGQYNNVPGSQYGGQSHGRMNSGGRGGLSDLWDSQPAQVPQTQSQSLRSPRPTASLARAFDSGSRQNSQGSTGTLDPYSQSSPGARPLPSQRVGSFQNTQSAGAPTKADRLRARLQGGGSGQTSPAPTSSTEYFRESDSFGRQESSSSNPYMSASQPWSNNNGSERDLGAGVNSRGFGNPAYRPRLGGPR